LKNKYADMDLEEKAFTILKDLGMIDDESSDNNDNTNDEPASPSVLPPSSVPAPVKAPESSPSAVSELEPLASSKTNNPLRSSVRNVMDKFASSPAKNDSDLEPVDVEKEKSAEPSTIPAASTTKNLDESRQQPKPKQEEDALRNKYANMDLEEKAYTILKDLGMIESSDDQEPRDD
jgi:hypothetical protein